MNRSPEPIVLLHSGGFSSRQWRRLADRLSSGYRVIAPDLLGYAPPGSWPDGKPFHFRQDLEFIASLADEPAHFVGHSYGGFLALQFALTHPARVRSIAVYDPVAFGVLDPADDADAREPLRLVSNDYDGEPWLESFVDWWNGKGAWSRLPVETREAFHTMGWKVFQEVMSLVADTTDRATYATIAAPALIMGGSKSPLTERRTVERLGAALPNAITRFFDAGHMGPISHSGPVNDAIAEHLAAAAASQT